MQEAAAAQKAAQEVAAQKAAADVAAAKILRQMGGERLDLARKWAGGVGGSWTERALLLIESGVSELLQCCERGRVLVD